MSKTIQELTDRELAEGQYKYVKMIESNTSSIKTWVVIWSIVSILGILALVIQLG
jgi:hypothetical protein